LALSVGDRQDHGTVDGTAWLAFRKEVGLNAAYLRDRARVLLQAIAREAAALREMSGFTAFYAGEWSCPGLVDSSGAFGVGRLCVGPFVLDGGLVSEGRVTA
jgi:hypothetical protein